MHATYLSDIQWKDLRPHLRVGSGGMGILVEIPVYLRLSQGKFLCCSTPMPPLVSLPTPIAFEQVLTCCSIELCLLAVWLDRAGNMHIFIC